MTSRPCAIWVHSSTMTSNSKSSLANRIASNECSALAELKMPTVAPSALASTGQSLSPPMHRLSSRQCVPHVDVSGRGATSGRLGPSRARTCTSADLGHDDTLFSLTSPPLGITKGARPFRGAPFEPGRLRTRDRAPSLQSVIDYGWCEINGACGTEIQQAKSRSMCTGIPGTHGRCASHHR